jgi:4-oxalocrotonate tautomerase
MERIKQSAQTHQAGCRGFAPALKDVVALIKCGEESVSLAIEEIKPQDWAEKVYKPDILGKWEKLYKKPGYNPFE